MKNKTILLYLLVFLFTTFSGHRVHAQDYYSSTYQYKPISLGITFAPNMAWMRHGDAGGYQNTQKFGFADGLLAVFAFTENYYFATGLYIKTDRKSVRSGRDVFVSVDLR